MKDDLYTRLVALQHPILHCTDAEKNIVLQNMNALIISVAGGKLH